MKKTALLLTALSLFILNACNIGFEKTKSGLEYKIIKGDGKGESLAPGDVVKFEYRITFKDSMVMNSYDFMPVYDLVDSVGRYHDFSEFLTKMKVGDSAVSFQLHDSLEKNSQFGVPPYMKKGDKQQMTIKILTVFKSKNGKQARDFAQEDYDKEFEKYKNRELAEIEKYLKVKKINSEKYKNNIYLTIDKEGNGKRADSGKIVGIKYNGYTFEEKYFDSNIDEKKQTSKHPLDTFYFQSNMGGAIQGMSLGIDKFNKGSKGRMFIPSIFGYGPQGNPPNIKPNQNLIFDVEVVDVFTNLFYLPIPTKPYKPGEKINLTPDNKSTDGASKFTITPNPNKFGLNFNNSNGIISGIAPDSTTNLTFVVKGFIGTERVSEGPVVITVLNENRENK
jgi:FKBP-type peptidyl-prolyl cis-trans isomerase